MSIALYLLGMMNIVFAGVNVYFFASDPANAMNAGTATFNALLGVVLVIQAVTRQ